MMAKRAVVLDVVVDKGEVMEQFDGGSGGYRPLRVATGSGAAEQAKSGRSRFPAFARSGVKSLVAQPRW